MKLRNKKTGEIIVFSEGIVDLNKIGCKNVAEMMEQGWEDYEEPKEYWFVDSGGEVEEATYLTDNDKSSLRNFGNYFETKEEAEKAVERLKAWKRLRDTGFKFKDFSRLNDCACFIRATFDESWSELYDDLNLLFGGKE